MKSSKRTEVQSRGTATVQSDPELLLDSNAIALALHVEPGTVAKWRRTGAGPPFVRISSRCVRYKRQSLIDWVNSKMRWANSGSLSKQ